MMKKVSVMFFVALSVCCIAFALAACGTSKNAEDSLTIAQSSVVLEVGDAYEIEYTYTKNNASSSEVIFLSSNASVVTVGAGNSVHAVGAGIATVTITSSDGALEAVCTIKVLLKTYYATFIADGEVVEILAFNVQTKSLRAAVPEKAGYTAEWLSYQLGEADITIYAVYTPIVYNITFLTEDGESLASSTYTVEDKNVTPPAVPEKAGYSGVWESYTLTTGDVEISPVYTPIVYNAKFIADGKTVKTVQFTVEDTALAEPNVPVKTGYSGAWESYAITNADITIVAVYTAVNYKIYFLDINGETVEEKTFTVEYEGVDEPTVPERAGYTGAWSDYELGAADIYVNPVYTEIVYKITYENTKDQEIASAFEYTISSDDIELADLSVFGYAFDGWYDGGKKVTKISASELRDITLTAVWRTIDYYIYFVGWDYEVCATITYTVETESITAPQVPEKEGYTGAWRSYSLNFSDENYVYADYSSVTYSVSFIAGDDIITLSYTKDGVITEPEVPFVEGYSGVWQEYELDFSQNLRVYAVYTPIEYKINFVVNGEVISTQIYTVENAGITEPQVPQTEHYTGAWQSYSLSYSDDLYVYAQYTPVEYGVNFAADGETVALLYYTVESKNITEPQVPQKANYTGEWASYTLDFSEGLVVNAVYTPVEYSVSFIINNDVVETQNYTVESAEISEPEIPEKAGYTASWQSYELDYTDLLVYVEYTPIKYGVTFMADGEIVKTLTYTVESAAISEPAVPEKEYYIGTWQSYELGFLEEQIVNAAYTPIEYYVSFVADGDLVKKLKYTVEYASITEPEVPEKTGYRGAWSGYELDFSDNLTVYAEYTLIEYCVSFVADYEVIDVQTYTVANKAITEPQVPFVEGYSGVWESYKLDYSSVLYVFAEYTAIEYSVIFTADGKTVDTLYYTIENAEITEPTVPAKTGYTGAWEEYTLTTGDITVNAEYTAITYIVTFIADNDVIGTQSYTVENMAITEPTVPAKTGYTGAWVEYTLTTGDITVNAEYTAIIYNVTFIADNDVIGTQSYTVENAEITEPTVPDKTGYTGVWEEYTLTTGDITVLAVYNEIETGGDEDEPETQDPDTGDGEEGQETEDPDTGDGGEEDNPETQDPDTGDSGEEQEPETQDTDTGDSGEEEQETENPDTGDGEEGQETEDPDTDDSGEEQEPETQDPDTSDGEEGKETEDPDTGDGEEEQETENPDTGDGGEEDNPETQDPDSGDSGEEVEPETPEEDTGEDEQDYSNYEFKENASGYTIVAYNGEEESVQIPSTYNGAAVTEIGEKAFAGNACITEVIVPDSVTVVGMRAFANCTALKTAYIGASVQTMGEAVFSGCSKLATLTIPFVGNNASASKAAYTTLFGYIFGEDSYSGGTATEQYYSSSSKTYYIPTTLKTVTVLSGKLYYGAFYGCGRITSIILGEGVSYVGEYAFYGCSKITSITIGAGVSYVGAYAFSGCSSLSTLTFADANGWSNSSTGKTVDLSDPSTNATNFLTDNWLKYAYEKSE